MVNCNKSMNEQRPIKIRSKNKKITKKGTQFELKKTLKDLRLKTLIEHSDSSQEWYEEIDRFRILTN